MVQEVVSHDLFQVWASLRISRQNPCDQVSGCVRNIDMIREGVAILADASVRGFDVSRLEGRFTDDQRVDDHTDGPDVDLVGVALLALEHLRSDIVRRTANGALALTVEFEFRGETEVTDLDLHLVVQEEVTQLQVTMDDSVTMKVFDGSTDLVDVALDLELMKTLTTAQQLIKRLILAQLE